MKSTDENRIEELEAWLELQKLLKPVDDPSWS